MRVMARSPAVNRRPMNRRPANRLPTNQMPMNQMPTNPPTDRPSSTFRRARCRPPVRGIHGRRTCRIRHRRDPSMRGSPGVRCPGRGRPHGSGIAVCLIAAWPAATRPTAAMRPLANPQILPAESSFPVGSPPAPPRFASSHTAASQDVCGTAHDSRRTARRPACRSPRSLWAG